MKLTAMEITKGNLLIDHPFFGAIAVRLECISTDEIETAATNGRQLLYNPTWFEGLSPAERLGLVAHEILHIANLHHTRRGSRDHDLFNIAGDFAINSDLQEAGFTLPPGALIDARWDGMGAEQIYAVLDQMAPKDRPKPCGWGEVRDAVGEDGQPVPANEMALEENEAKIIIGQAMQQAKSVGRMPANLARKLGILLQPTVDWRAALHQFVQVTSKDNHDWRRPNRRLIGHGFYLPRVRGEHLEIMVAIDTSGSVGEEELRQFLGEVEGILSVCSAKIWLVYCDAQINRVDEVTSEDLPLECSPCGGGGTDFRPVFQYWEECPGEPSCLVYITDMCGSFPEAAPEFPVLWVKTTDVAAPFGEEVRINVPV